MPNSFTIQAINNRVKELHMLPKYIYRLEYITDNEAYHQTIYTALQPVAVGDLIETMEYHAVVAVIHSFGSDDEPQTALLLSDGGQSPQEAFLIAQQAGHLPADRWPSLSIS